MRWEPANDEGLRHLGQSLDDLARRLGIARADAIRKVFGRWPEIVGDRVAAHVRPRSLREGILVVMVDSPGWATQLRYLEADLLRRLREVAGPDAVHRIEVRVAHA